MTTLLELLVSLNCIEDMVQLSCYGADILLSSSNVVCSFLDRVEEPICKISSAGPKLVEGGIQIVLNSCRVLQQREDVERLSLELMEAFCIRLCLWFPEELVAAKTCVRGRAGVLSVMSR